MNSASARAREQCVVVEVAHVVDPAAAQAVQLRDLGHADRGLVEDAVHAGRTVEVRRDLGHEQQRVVGHRRQPDASGWYFCSLTQHVPCGLPLDFRMHSDDGGSLLWIFTTWYSVGP